MTKLRSRLSVIALLVVALPAAIVQAQSDGNSRMSVTVSFGGGLSALPAWVRGLDRVRTWVWAKLLINAARIVRNKHLRHV